MSTPNDMPPFGGDFGAFVRRAHAQGRLVVQPRMGFGDPALMREGLAAVARLPAATAGTITLDSYTRVGDYRAIEAALANGERLNGYPIVSLHPDVTLGVTLGLAGPDFQIQVRHGSPDPLDIVRAMSRVGLYATEGGPLSYCLPYGRLPVRRAVDNWRRCCEELAALRRPGAEPHLETFGGCLLGQLCPPSLLVAVSVLEALFFRRHGLRSVSLSYAQQTNHQQDLQALAALRTLARRHLSDVDWHVVLYTYMGLFPATRSGAMRLAEQSVRLAAQGGVERLIVKTAAEAHRIPTIADNTQALRAAADWFDEAGRFADGPGPMGGGDHSDGDDGDDGSDNEVLHEACALIEAVLELSDDVGRALVEAMRGGLLDVPYCLHPDNAGNSRSFIDARGRLAWSRAGAMPVRPQPDHDSPMSSAQLLAALSYVADRSAAASPYSTASRREG
ncbi:methylaspartate mutase [Streptomyces olivaceoviridis]|uniref:methylaspartate mutase n=1 Tax=Streptomyces olivaceoviridis TaxID=1921 RepID=UPI0019C020A7|nr:methylaspartate mutase [Streptomyces olivaceoviridis]GGZ01392.1 methylaspartate mutase [Streptomyces olivaceoviridis]